MQRIYIITIVLLSFLSSSAQNAFDFDGIDDYAEAPDALSFLQSDSITITLWVYPTSSFSGWPDFEGFAGFRNDNNADFYIIQLDSASVEARFRNDQGAAFDITYSGLKLNEWQHFAFTYDLDSIRLYHNGVLVKSTLASGKMFKPNQPFNMGYLPYTGNNFYLNGKIDEVSLWGTTLADSAIACIYTNGVNLKDNQLKLFYPFNQGIPSGANVGEDSAYTYKSHFDAQIHNATLSGSESNWVLGIDDPYNYTFKRTCMGDSIWFNNQWIRNEGVYCKLYAAANSCDSLDVLYVDMGQPPSTSYSASICDGDTFTHGTRKLTQTGYYDEWYTTSGGCDSISFVNLTVYPSGSATIQDTFCQGDPYSFNGDQIASAGTYYDTIKTGNNCDSIVTLELEMISLDTGIVGMSNILTANELFATSYQWLDCANSLPVVGETNRSLVVPKTGRYKCLVQKGQCAHQTRCVEVDIINSVKEQQENISIYPNPTKGLLQIKMSGDFIGAKLLVFDMLGKEVFTDLISSEIITIDLRNQGDGPYLIKIEGEQGVKEYSVLKQSEY